MTTTAETPQCPKCGSRATRWRRRTLDWACDRCPHTWTQKPAKERKPNANP